eukprot:CAMPEP_0172918726 /NCGR_PEP_ID=MMETSP1075-20121228/200757_1 /TAXON_ID=2916 /ORGANISM="Ceratium fusus, Strain PA161109" /LENGTH=51 /DNA_ID=CAMNT_0013778439 /DNA_START=128 /DNA_END=280 /DNA_ORIENTATION=+
MAALSYIQWPDGMEEHMENAPESDTEEKEVPEGNTTKQTQMGIVGVAGTDN